MQIAEQMSCASGCDTEVECLICESPSLHRAHNLLNGFVQHERCSVTMGTGNCSECQLCL